MANTSSGSGSGGGFSSGGGSGGGGGGGWGIYEGVQYLESQKLLDAANTINECIKEYNEIIKRITNTTNDLLGSWYGEGKTEFEKDYTTIYQQLSDISDIMYDLYDALVDADATYVQTDEEIAKGMTMEG